MNTERRWVIFDLGKVLLDFDFAIAAKELARYSPQEEEQILESINQYPLLHTF
jgi:FMN phosphatase YigB (HAD superfamily)